MSCGVTSFKPARLLCSGGFYQSLLLSTAIIVLPSVAIMPVRAQSVSPQPQCSISGSTVTCSGDLSVGVDIQGGAGGAYTNLIIENVTTNITPSFFLPGILFDSNGDITINSDTGDFIISTDGRNAIEVNPGGGDVSLTHTGGIQTISQYASGVEVRDADAVTITHTGDITTDGYYSRGIEAVLSEEITITHTGDIATTGNMYAQGIYATTQGGSTGAITITQTGNVDTADTSSTALFARSDGTGDVSITHVGTLTTAGNDSRGIFARARGVGAVTIDQSGTITTGGDTAHGIMVYSENTATVTHSGTINANGTSSDGILISDGLAPASTFQVNLTNSTINAQSFGINIQTVGDTTFTLSGTNAISGVADDIKGGTGDDTINNSGTLTSTNGIDLDAGTNAFNNLSGATFNSGTSVVLGAGNALTNAGLISPGGESGIEITTITGDFVNETTGSMLVTFDSSMSNWDVLDISGSANLQGGVVSTTGATFTAGSTFTILEVLGGVTGTFDSVEDTLFIDWSLSYGANFVNLTATAIADNFCGFASNENQRSVACIGLDSLPLSDPLPQALLGLSNGAEARAAYDDLSGEIYASIQGALVENNYRRMALINNRIRNADASLGSISAAFAPEDPTDLEANRRNDFWGIGYGAWSNTFGTSDTASLDNSLGGLLFGYDREFAEETLAGVLGGYGRTNVKQDARSSSGSATTWSIGIYGETVAKDIGFVLAGIYNWHFLEGARTVDFSTINEREHSSYKGRGWQFYAEANYEVPVMDTFVFEPFLGVSYIDVHTDGFAEDGGTAALTKQGGSFDSTFTNLGVRGVYNVHDWFNVNASLSWRHAYGDTDPSALLAFAGSTAFGVDGAPISQDAFELEVGLDARATENLFVNAEYNGQFGDNATIHVIELDFTIKF
ncbi:autotransporter outer membrane beta-barrel domain-containing protein [Pseudovibrio ascidiaceicola]|uniref:autotransporter family protein n=1 Tax=Pseudovibrio ascidiaceicola TaxID=285279 RepID=UPI001AD8AF92|nr:autotransporter outer membrane beta-barrel domain-containing protein [Pseudovibrio ascidiaceicola]